MLSTKFEVIAVRVSFLPTTLSMPPSLTPPPTLTTGAAILFHVHQTWRCYPQGLTSTALSPIPAFSRMGTILPLPCISLLTETPQQKQTLKLQTPPCLQPLWAVQGGGRGAGRWWWWWWRDGIMEPFDTVKIRKKRGLALRPAEETISMQLFSQRPHLVEFAAKQEVEVRSVH